MQEKSEEKFSSNWEETFRVREVADGRGGGGGGYQLEWLSRKIVPRTWNATHLKFYYSQGNKIYALFPRPTVSP